MLNAGVMDIAGDTVIVRNDVVKEVAQWIADGRMIAMAAQRAGKSTQRLITRPAGPRSLRCRLRIKSRLPLECLILLFLFYSPLRAEPIIE